MDIKAQKAKQKAQIRTKNVLEAINEIGSQVVSTAKDEVKATSDEFFRQLLGQQKALQQKRTGEVPVGKPLEINKVMSGEHEKSKKLQDQMFFERRLFSEERQYTDNKLNELRLRLKAIQEEANKIMASTVGLSQEIKTAVMKEVVNVSDYQINFYEDIIRTMMAFRKKIDSAVVWMQGQNKRGEKKNYWNQYKKKGASFLLSPDHYSQRNAG